MIRIVDENSDLKGEDFWDRADMEIFCDCGNIIFVSKLLYDLWNRRGIGFTCEKCKRKIVAII